MRIAIVGGCFTNQHNIPFNGLYHQTLKRILDKDAEIKTIRYERITKSLEKIENLFDEYDFTVLIFHLRTEPLMRMSKLYYKYFDNEGKLRHSINFPSLNIFYPEKFNLLTQTFNNVQISKHKKETKLYHLLRETNYLFGTLLGNKRYSLEVFEKSILEIHEFTQKNKIQFLLLGPVSRPFSKFEDKLSEELNRKFELLANEKNIDYLSLIKKVTANNESMFFDNGIHVNQTGHDEIAQMISGKLLL